MTGTHLDLEALSAFADRDLPAVARARAESHLAECASCRHALERVRSLVRSASTLPRDVAPPPEVWQTIRARMRPRALSRPWMMAGFAVAATLVVMAGTTLLRPGPGRSAKVRDPGAVQAVPVALSSVDRNYQPSIEELRFTLEQQRASPSPATVRVLERSLAVIDTAIAEARAALAADPGNEAIAAILAGQYEQKVFLLQRATKLSSSS